MTRTSCRPAATHGIWPASRSCWPRSRWPRARSLPERTKRHGDDSRPDGTQDQGDQAARRDPPGYYMGRPIADVMSFAGADWLFRETREQEEQPETMLDALEDRQGGDRGRRRRRGRLHEPPARPPGRADGDGLRHRRPARDAPDAPDNAREAGVTNIKPHPLAPRPRPSSPTATVDLILMVDVYHECSDPEATLKGLRKALKPGGRLVLVEFRGEDPDVPIKPEHKMTLAQVRREVEPQGFIFKDSYEFLPGSTSSSSRSRNRLQRPVRLIAASVGSASNGWFTGLTTLLSWTSRPALPTRKLWPSATWRLKTGWTWSVSTDSTAPALAERTKRVARLEVAGHHPALTDLPEPMDAGRHDGLAARGDFESLSGLVMEDCEHRHVAQPARRRVLGEHPISDAD